MNQIFMIVVLILSVVISVACIVGAVFIYRAYVSTCSIGEFMGMFKTQGYLKSLFRFDRLVSPKILQFFYGLNALSVIGTGLILLIAGVFTGISNMQIQLILGGIIGCIVLIVVGEIFLRIGYEVAILFFKMNESLTILKEAQIAQGFSGVASDDRMATEVIGDAINSFKNKAKGNQPTPQSTAQTVKICPNCGTQNNQNAKFCKGCGAGL